MRSSAAAPLLLPTLWSICCATQIPLQLQPQEPHSTRPALPTTRSIMDAVIQLHRDLVNIESTTGHEEAVGNWLATYLEEKGLTVQKQHVVDNRFNVLAYKGESPVTKVLVTSHIDTVPPYIPYSTRNHDTELWGRGTVDAKACVAAQTIALLNLLSAGKIPTDGASLLFVVGEEVDGIGMRHFAAHAPTNYSAVVFGEPTEGKLVSGHKGLLIFHVEITGKAAHSGYPWLGLNANTALVEALAGLLDLEQELPRSEKLGQSTVNVGKVGGGVAINVIPESAFADVSIRVAKGSPEDIQAAVLAKLEPVKRRLEKAGGELRVEWKGRPYAPTDIDADIPGFETMTVNYGTDIPNFHGDHKKYLYGPGSILVAHSAVEHLRVIELVDAEEAFEKIILSTVERA